MIWYSSYNLDHMASILCNDRNASPCADDKSSRRPENGQDDWSRLPQSNCSYRGVLQLELDLWEPHVLVLECGIHPDVKSTMKAIILITSEF
jgi:hypothetical protein